MHFEYDTEEDLSRYMVHHAPEIERVLRGMANDRTLVTLYGDSGSHFVLSTIVDVDPAANALYLEWGPDMRQNQAILDSEDAVVTAVHERVRVQFMSRGVTRVDRSGDALFKLELPARLLRLQRREGYRLLTSLTHPLQCSFDLGGQELETVVTDISVGGLGLLYQPGGEQLVQGKVYGGCRLHLPDIPPLLVNLDVRTAYEETMKNGLLALRAGCQFADLSPGSEAAVQRYIFKVERERRARLR